MGRIFRISQVDAKRSTWTSDLSLGNASHEQLLEKLSHPNIWWRRTAQRLLLDRKSPEVVAGLIDIVSSSTSALGRLHALWTLQGLNELRREQIVAALRDPEPGVRMNAIKLAELHLKEHPAVIPDLLALQ